MTNKQFQERVLLELETFNKNFKELTKQFNSIQRSCDLIYEDRDILTDIQNGTLKIRELILSADAHNENLTKGVKQAVESKAEEVKFTVEESTTDMKKKVVHKVPQIILNSIQQSFKKTDSGTKLTKKNKIEYLLSKLNIFKLFKKGGVI